MIYSYSRLSTFEGCMKKGYYQYKENRPTPSGMPAQVGKIFHNAQNFVINEGFEPNIATYASIYEANGLPEGETIENLIRLTERGYKWILDLQTEFTEILSENHIVVEIAPGLQVQAYLDLIIDDPSNDSLLLGDFKTSWVSYPADRTHQLRLYGLMYKIYKNFVPTTFKGRLIFPRLGPEQDTEIIFTEEMLEETRQWVIELVKRVEEAGEDINNYPMTSNKRTCELCPFVGLCASNINEQLPSVPSDHIEAEHIGDYILLQEQFLKNMKENLKQYVKSIDKVETSKGVWEFKLSEPNPKIDINELKLYADAKGIEFNTLISVDNKKLKELLQKDTEGELQKLVKYTNPRNSFVFTEISDENGFYEDEVYE